MNPLKRIIALTAVILAPGFIGAAYGQYSTIGTTAGGGNIIVGNGTLPALGPNAPLSAGGFDNVTLNPGSMATSGGQDVVTFATSNDTLLNNGTVLATNGVNGVSFVNFSGNLSNETMTNNGSITGGADGSLGDGGMGIYFDADSNLNNITLTNNGGVVGGSGTGSSFNDGGAAIEIECDGTMSYVTLTNNGTATGGNGNGGSFGDGGHGIYLDANGTLTNVTLINNGNALGGSGNNGFGDGGNAIYIESDENMANVTLTNNGSATGGSGNEGAFGDGGHGIYLDANGTLTNVTLINNGNALGGSGNNGFGDGGNAIYIESDENMANVTLTNNGSATGGSGNGGDFGEGGHGIDVSSSNAMTNVTVTNNGSATGGSSTNGEGLAGHGIFIESNGLMSYLTLTNNGSATGGNSNGGGFSEAGHGILVEASDSLGNLLLTNNGSATGGNSTNGEGDNGHGICIEVDGTAGNVTLVNNGSALGGSGSGGSAGTGGSGIFIEASAAINNLTIFNNGSATGGNGSQGSSGSGGDGIHIDASGGGTSLTLTNFGSAKGGNAAGGGNAGNGVSSDAGSLVINNWGAITSGAGPNPAAINLHNSSNNVVNLNGHSSVNGPITANGAANSNIVNLNFTGLMPANLIALKTLLLAQGVNTGVDTPSVTFTLRGVTYNIDPAVVNFNMTSYQLQALTPNQAAVGASLDSLTYNPAPGTPLFTMLNAIDASGNVPGALEQLSPQAYEVYGDMAIENANFLVQSIDARLDNIRNGSESIQTTGMGATASTSGPEYSVAGLTKDGDGKESKTIAPPEPAPDRWGFFATGDGLFFRGNPHDLDAQDAKADTAGTIVGVDGKVGDKGVLGALFSYNNSAVSMDGSLDHATIQSYTGGIYGSFKDQGFYLNALAAYTRNDYTSTRNILISGFGAAANGSTNGNQATVNLDGGYDWNATSRLSVGPMAGVQYVHLGVDGFNETGAGPADLAVNSEDINSLQSRVGFRTSYHLASSQTSACSAELHAAWQHEYLDDSRGIGASFAGTGMAPFAVQTASPRRDAAVVGIGLDATFHNRLTLFADYELEIWSASYFEQTINGGARISF